MWELIWAAMLLLSTYDPDAYEMVSRYPIQVIEEERPYAGMALCAQNTIVLVAGNNSDVLTTLGTLVHEAKHLNDGCPIYNVTGEWHPREAAAYRYEFTVLEKIRAPIGLTWWKKSVQEWVMSQYWTYWWKEHGAVRSLGIL